jgi:hypothetical protein
VFGSSVTVLSEPSVSCSTLTSSLEPWVLAIIRILLSFVDESGSVDMDAEDSRTEELSLIAAEVIAWFIVNCGGDAMESMEELLKARDGIDPCVLRDGLRDPDGDPGRDCVGVECLGRDRERRGVPDMFR